MPDRVIRDEIRGSDRWLNLRRNTHRLAFLICLLEADDRANLEAGDGALWRLWQNPLALTDRQSVPEILLALVDSDLIRLYEVDGKRYAHIPKFRQRLRYINGKHPRPPSVIECKEIKSILEKSPTKDVPKTDHGQTADGLKSAEVEVKRSEEKRSEVEVVQTYPQAAAPTKRQVQPGLEKKKNGATAGEQAALIAEGIKLGIVPNRGEVFIEFAERIRKAKEKAASQ